MQQFVKCVFIYTMHTTYTQHVSTAAQQFIAQQNSKTFHSSAFFFLDWERGDERGREWQTGAENADWDCWDAC